MQTEESKEENDQEKGRNWTKMYILVMVVLAVQIVLYYWFTNTFS